MFFSGVKYFDFKTSGEPNINQSSILGLYKISHLQANNFPIYKHLDEERYLHVGSDGLWRVSSSLFSQEEKHLRNPVSNPTPPIPPETGWEIFDSEWEEDANITLVPRSEIHL